jgi:hypothetical protein
VGRDDGRHDGPDGRLSGQSRPRWEVDGIVGHPEDEDETEGE